ncbi:hypothetical protein B7P43_G16127 [Cryptotermes secundus]|uniref:F-box domain-containing protein n=1 Tax=Cryptotermes secundus TaxID=105785 RepID=A0A2J7Q5E5_9NEOP|nr:uncharacterized protein LOC111869706 isoform X2 [Cryptotermes secundus]XP_023717185.1 uncharacterized protein LOC111869706 isoform X2 [Cryptotermes secundus]PNF23800.1 hypothetical protein B7P43_G16127 [Cryptotermes secundus]
MGKRNYPVRLEELAFMEVCQMVRGAGVNWTRRLNEAAVTGHSSWLQEVKSVEEECVLVRAHLASLPVPLVSEVIIFYAFQEFIKLVEHYHHHDPRPLISRIIDRQVHESVCINMLKAVLLPCISKCDIRNMNSGFVQELVIKLLCAIPNIKSLNLPPLLRPRCVHLLVERFQILTHLEEFCFHTGCTTEIIIQLSKYCPHIKTISVQDSSHVDDGCVEHLLKLRDLLSLNFAKTSISTNSYAALLSGLPEMRDIIWFGPIEPVLGNLTSCLPSVVAFLGVISDAKLFVQKCPNIKQLYLYSPSQDISGLGELRNVASISILNSSYSKIRFNDVINRLGPRLEIFEACQVDNINLDDVINYCTDLRSLSINFSQVTCAEMFHPELPHFQNLEKLKIRGYWGAFSFCSVLHLYVNLTVVHFVGVEQITNTVIRQIVTAGGFRNLTEFFVDHCGYVTMETAWLLMQNCPNLTKIGNIGSWSHVTEDQVVTFLNTVRHNNVCLTLDT